VYVHGTGEKKKKRQSTVVTVANRQGAELAKRQQRVGGVAVLNAQRCTDGGHKLATAEGCARLGPLLYVHSAPQLCSSAQYNTGRTFAFLQSTCHWGGSPCKKKRSMDSGAQRPSRMRYRSYPSWPELSLMALNSARCSWNSARCCWHVATNRASAPAAAGATNPLHRSDSWMSR